MHSILKYKKNTDLYSDLTQNMMFYFYVLSLYKGKIWPNLV